MDQLYRSDEKEGISDNVSRNTATAIMTGYADNNSAMRIRPDFPTDVPIEENKDREMCNI